MITQTARAAACLLALVGACGACGTKAMHDVPTGAGRIEFADGSILAFDEVLELAFQPEVPSEADTAELRRWPLKYSPTTPARSVPLAWVAALDIVAYKPDAGCACMHDVTLDIRTVNDVAFRTPTRTLEWIRIRAVNDRNGETRQVFFAEAAGPHVRRVVFE